MSITVFCLKNVIQIILTVLLELFYHYQVVSLLN